MNSGSDFASTTLNGMKIDAWTTIREQDNRGVLVKVKPQEGLAEVVEKWASRGVPGVGVCLLSGKDAAQI